MKSLVEQRDTIVGTAKAIAEKAKAAGRDLTTEELSTINAALDDVKALSGKIAEAKESEDMMTKFGLIGPEGHEPGSGPQYLDLSAAGRKSMAQSAARAMTGIVDGQKSAILPAGETYLSVPTVPELPIVLGKQTQPLLSLLPVTKIPAGAKARYLRQTTRTNNAAAVAPGTQKPVSIYGLTPQDVDLAVYAHLSEPIDRFALEDANSLAQFVANELLYGLWLSVEKDVIQGDGAPVGIVGILGTSGVRTQPFVTDILTTTRAAITTSESLGYADSLVFVLSPEDWSAAQLLQAQTGGGFLMNGAPQEMPAASLWGVPVTVSIGLPASTGLLLDRSGLALYSDQQGVRVDWSPAATGFELNTITARCEGRFALGVLRPEAQVNIATATTP